MPHFPSDEELRRLPPEARQYLLGPSAAMEEAYAEAQRSGRPEHRAMLEGMARPGIERLQRLEEPPPPPERNPENMPSDVERPKDLPGLITEFGNQVALQRQLEPFGAGAKKKAKEVAAKRKGLIPKPGQSLSEVLSPKELRFVLADDNFAKRLLEQWGYNTSSAAILSLRKTIYNEHPEVIKNLPPMAGKPFPSFEQEKSNFGKFGQYFYPGDYRKVAEEAEARLDKYENLKHLEESYHNQANRLAPLQPSHEKAKKILENSKPSESLRLAEKEIAAAGRTNIPRDIGPYLAQASSSPQAFVNQYKVDYAPLIENYRQEARKDFMEHVIPSINNKFIGAGAFNSSARNATIAKAKADKEKRIENEIAKLLVHSQEEGMKHYHQHREGTLKQAEIAGHAHKSEQDSRLRAAEALRVNSAIENSSNQQNAAALSQMGSMEQRQKQNEMNVAQQEYMEERERPLRDIERQAALAHGIPMQPFQLSPERINPPPPNPLAFGAGVLGQLAGLGMQPPQAAYKQGGQVRRGFAAGDSVARSMGQLQQLRNQGVQESPEEAEMRSSAQAFKNHRANPMADYLFATGSHMLANMGEDPIRTYGQGSQLGMQAYKSAQGENLSAKEKYNNLIGKINQSKMYQHELATKYHLNQQQQEEQQRYHNATLGESKRAHDMMYGNRAEAGAEKPVKLSASEKKVEHDAQKDLLRAVRMKKELGELGGLIKQSTTGPWLGQAKKLVPQTKVDNKIASITNKLILDMHQGMKNIPRSEEFMKRLESTKPSTTNYEETNEAAISMMNEGANDVLEHSIASLLSAGWTPEKIKKRFKIDVPQHLLEGEEMGEESPEGGSGGMVPIVGPDGEEWMIPKENVEAAIQAGGKLA